MDDREYKKQQVRTTKLFQKWKPLLGLETWCINVRYVRDPSEFTHEDDVYASQSVLMDCEAHWEYKQAFIRVNTRIASLNDDESIEDAVIHELLHCIVSEMRDWSKENTKHEERVVSELSGAMIRVYEQAKKEESKRKKKGNENI